MNTVLLLADVSHDGSTSSLIRRYSRREETVAHGFDNPLDILPLDRRGSFEKEMFGWKGALKGASSKGDSNSGCATVPALGPLIGGALAGGLMRVVGF